MTQSEEPQVILTVYRMPSDRRVLAATFRLDDFRPNRPPGLYLSTVQPLEVARGWARHVAEAQGVGYAENDPMGLLPFARIGGGS